MENMSSIFRISEYLEYFFPILLMRFQSVQFRDLNKELSLIIITQKQKILWLKLQKNKYIPMKDDDINLGLQIFLYLQLILADSFLRKIFLLTWRGWGQLSHPFYQIITNIIKIRIQKLSSMQNIRRFWPLRNFANFSITVIGLTGIGLYYYSIRNERVFSNSPVVTQGIKILGMNSSARNLLGHPINYSGAYSNTYHLEQNQQYYNFQVKGPISYTTTQLSADRVKIQEINNKIKKVKQIEGVIGKKMQQIKELGVKNTKTPKKQKNAIVDQIKNAEDELGKLKTQLRAAQIDKIETLKKFYIPNDDMHPQVMKNKNPQAVLSDQQYLYGIKALSTNLPNKKMINIIPDEQQQKIDKNSQKYTQLNKKYLQVDQITEGYLRDRLKVGIDTLTDEQLQNYGKHKTMMMYGKYNGYRVGITLVLTFAMITVFLTWHIYRIIPVGGTLIAHQAQKLFMNHDKVGELIKASKKSKNHVKFSKVFSGGRRGDNFDCSVQIEGIPKGKLFFEGQQQEKGNIKFRKFFLEYRDGKEIKKIDLL